MKTTMSMQSTANPRRTTLTDLVDAEDGPASAQQREHTAALPQATANPRRTVLMEAPAGS